MNNITIIMSKKIFLFFFILQLTAILAQEQNLKAEPLSTQKIDADTFVGFDGMGNLYYLKNNVFYMKNDKESWQYKNVSLGKPTKIDIQNPLKIMLFYENFNTVIILDNQLNETQKINFSEKDVPIVASAAGNASQNRLWIYNSLTQQIGLFDFLKNTFQSITPSIQGNIKYYQSDFTTFQWIDGDLNLFSCDVFGKIISLGKISDFDQIQIVDSKEFIFLKERNLFLLDTNKTMIYTIENVEKSFTNFFYKDQILSIFTNQEIINYKIPKP
jgi:hypothetical protein